MKPVWKNGEFTVELHKPELAMLERCRDLGQCLIKMHQESGCGLVKAIDKVLGRTEVAEEEGEE